MMKVLISVILLHLCFSSLAFDIISMKSMVAVTKRDTLYTPECQAGALELELNDEYQHQESSRICLQPEPVPKTEHEYIIRCESPEAWRTSCTNAGGEICHVSASVFGKYGGDSNEEATYKWDADICIPVPCKKGDNIKQYENYFTGFLCPFAGLTQCKMSVLCGGKKKASAGLIAGTTFLALGAAVLLGLGVLFLFKRYQAFRNPAGYDEATFTEYTEISQYEKEDDAFISDTSDIGLADDEEEQSIN